VTDLPPMPDGIYTTGVFEEPGPVPPLRLVTNYRLGCEDDDGRPVHPDCVSETENCGCGAP
jgi:hypothetical protein